MPAKLKRCVKRVRAKGGVRNAYAVCVAATGQKPYKSGHHKKRRKKK